MANLLSFGGFLLRHWKWIALGLSVVAVWGLCVTISFLRGQVDAANAARDGAVARAEQAEANSAEWQKANADMRRLAIEDAKARAAETKVITIIREQASQARQEIQDAPGSDAGFRYSDPAYGFMRREPGSAQRDTAPTPAGVGR